MDDRAWHTSWHTRCGRPSSVDARQAIIEAAIYGIPERHQPLKVVPVAGPISKGGVYARGVTPLLARGPDRRTRSRQFGVTTTAHPNATTVEVVHVRDAPVAAAGHHDLRADEPYDGAGDVLWPSEVAVELDGDRVARLEGGELLGGEPVVDGHAMHSSLGRCPRGSRGIPEHMRAAARQRSSRRASVTRTRRLFGPREMGLLAPPRRPLGA